jgi:hypothetical protein
MSVEGTAVKWYHKGWPSFLLGVLVGGLFLAAPVGLGVRWIFKKAKGTLALVTPTKAA